MATGVVSIEQNTNLAQSGTSYVSCASSCRLERLAFGWLLASWLCSNSTVWLLSSYACTCDRCQIVIFQNCMTASSTSQSKEVLCSGSCKAIFGGQSWTLDSRCILVCHRTPLVLIIFSSHATSTGSHHISAVRCDLIPKHFTSCTTRRHISTAQCGMWLCSQIFTVITITVGARQVNSIIHKFVYDALQTLHRTLRTALAAYCAVVPLVHANQLLLLRL